MQTIHRNSVLRRTFRSPVLAFGVLVGLLSVASATGDPAPEANATQQPKVAAVELKNLTDEFLPRLGSSSEQALIQHFTRFSEARFLDRSAVSQVLIERDDRVALFPSDPERVADFGHDLGVDYVITGNILDYQVDGDVHRMMVEFQVVDVWSQDYVLRKVYDGEVESTSGAKQHREILGQLIEYLALDFETVLDKAASVVPSATE